MPQAFGGIPLAGVSYRYGIPTNNRIVDGSPRTYLHRRRPVLDWFGRERRLRRFPRVRWHHLHCGGDRRDLGGRSRRVASRETERTMSTIHPAFVNCDIPVFYATTEGQTRRIAE